MKLRAAAFSFAPLATQVSAAMLAACLFAPAPARATSMPERTAAEVAAEAALVVEATVVRARVARVAGRIVTFTELEIGQVLRASASESARAPTALTVALPGGALGAVSQRVVGTPTLVVGERYLLCLSAPVLDGARTVVGLWQGAWRLGDDGAPLPFDHDGPLPAPLSRAALERELRGAP